MRKDLYINGVDSTSIVPPTGYTVTYEKATGQNEGMMLDGSYTEDIIAIKAVVSFPIMPLDETKQSDFLQNVMSDKYATVYYFEPKINAYRTAVMRWSLSTTKFRGTGADGNEYWSGQTVTFRDRFKLE